MNNYDKIESVNVPSEEDLDVLDEAAQQKLVDFKKVITNLQSTTFRVSPKLIQSLLQQYK